MRTPDSTPRLSTPPVATRRSHPFRRAVLRGMGASIDFVDPNSGDIQSSLKLEGTWLSGLDFDGRHFVCGSREAVFWFDPESGRLERKLALHYPVRSLAAHAGKTYLMEQPLFGFDEDHKPVRTWPEKMLVHVWRPAEK